MHIIGEHQGTSDLPEHRHMKGVDGGYTGEKGVTLDQRARGMGGLQTSCGEENLLDLDSDPRYTHARTHARAHARTHARTQARTHARTCTHARKHARTHARAHARPHACVCVSGHRVGLC